VRRLRFFVSTKSETKPEIEDWFALTLFSSGHVVEEGASVTKKTPVDYDVPPDIFWFLFSKQCASQTPLLLSFS
jgi:hypothetical protein